MITLPNQDSKAWKQDNSSDLFGNIFVSKNLSFDKAGYLSLGFSPRAVMNENINADFGQVTAIVPDSFGEYFAITSDNIFDVSRQVLAETPTKNATTGVPDTDLQSDATWFNGVLPVTQDTDVDYFDPNTSTWTDTNITLTGGSNTQHPVANFISYNYYAIANINTVGLYSSPFSATPTLVVTLTIPTDFRITSMVYFNQNLYVGTQNRYSGKAAMYVWNGNGSAAQSVFEVESNIIFDLCVFKDSVVAFIGNGALMQFNGAGFSFLAGFPIFYKNFVLTGESNIGIYHNVLKASRDLLFINFSANENSEVMLLDQPVGVWCYDPNVGLYHRYSYSNSVTVPRFIDTSYVDPATDIVTVASPAVVTGTEVMYKADGATPFGLTDGTKYFAIKVDNTHVRIATTKANALANVYVNLSAVSGFGGYLIFFPNTDYGQILNNEDSNALATMNISLTQNDPYGTEIIWSSEIATRTSPTAGVTYLGSVSTAVEARGYYISPKVFSRNITDVYNKLVLKHSPMKSELDKIIIKYRVSDDGLDDINLSANTNWQITWTSTTTFTTTDTNWSRAVEGNEVSVLRGAAGGLLAHIVSIVNNSGTYTVTIDETYDNYLTGDISTAIFRNWIKFKTITMDNTDGFISNEIGAKGKFIQLKVELRGIGVRIEELSVDNTFFLPSK